LAGVYRLLQEPTDEGAKPSARNGHLPSLHQKPDWVEGLVSHTVNRVVWLSGKSWGQKRAQSLLRRVGPIGAPESIAAARRPHNRTATLPVQPGECGHSLRLQLVQLMAQGNLPEVAGNLRNRMDQYLVAERRQVEALVDRRRGPSFNGRTLWDQEQLDYWIEVMSEDGAPTIDPRPGLGEDAYIIVGLPRDEWSCEREADLKKWSSLGRVFLGQLECSSKCGDYYDRSFAQFLSWWRAATNSGRRFALRRECQSCKDLRELRRS